MIILNNILEHYKRSEDQYDRKALLFIIFLSLISSYYYQITINKVNTNYLCINYQIENNNEQENKPLISLYKCLLCSTTDNNYNISPPLVLTNTHPISNNYKIKINSVFYPSNKYIHYKNMRAPPSFLIKITA